jgi:hypothetical protein
MQRVLRDSPAIINSILLSIPRSAVEVPGAVTTFTGLFLYTRTRNSEASAAYIVIPTFERR